MENAKITTFQLLCFIILFELGTALMLPLGLDAKQDAWIAIMVGMVGGVFIFYMYYYLYHHYPDLMLTSYVKIIFGKYIGTIVGMLYVLFFIYGAARDLRDGTELLELSYSETPISALSILLMSVIIYALYKGIEALVRAGEIYFMFTIFFIMIGIISLFLSDVIDINKLLPVLEKGWKLIFTTVFGQTLMFPFGEMICFTMILPYLNNPELGLKIGILGIILSGFILSLIIILEISVMGVENTSRSIFPFLEMMQKINVGDFLQRLDAVVMVSLIINDFFKVAIFSYAAVIGSADLFKVQKNKLVIPIGIIIFFTTLLIAQNVLIHFAQGKFSLKFIFTPFVVMIPFLLVIVEMFRKWSGTK